MSKKAATPAVAAHHPQHTHMSKAQHQAAVSSARKAAKTRKHNAALAAKHGAAQGKHKSPNVKKPTSALLAGDVCCCTPQALAESLRMAGWPAGEGDILALYFALTDNPESGVTVAEALEAASRIGLAGVQPIEWSRTTEKTWIPGDICVLDLPNGELHSVAVARNGLFSWGGYIPRKLWIPGTHVAETWTVRWPR